MSARETELRQEIEFVRSQIGTWESADMTPVQKLMRTQMQRRLDGLESELEAAIDRVLELHFEDADRPGFKALSTPVLSVILGRLQSTLTYGTWAHRAGPSVAGSPPVSVERSARTEVVATPPGSFRLVLRKSELEMDEDFDRSVEMIFELAQAASEGELNDDFGAKAQELGREANRRLELFFKKLAEEQLDTDFSWQSPDQRREVYVSHSVADSLSKWLAEVVPTIERITVVGYLRRADTLTGSFKIEEEATARIYEGAGDADVLAHAEMDALYSADIEYERRSSPHTGRVTERFSLKGLTPTAGMASKG